MAKLGPKLYASFSSGQAFNAAIPKFTSGNAKVMSDASKLLTQTTALPAVATERFDYVGLMADWDVFRETVDLTFVEFAQSLGNAVIKGMAEFRTALRQMYIRGQAVLETRRVTQDETHKYLRNVAETTARQKRGEDIKAMKLPHNEDGILTRQAIEQRIIQAEFCRDILEGDLAQTKRDLFVLFHTLCNSCIYHCAASSYPDHILARMSSAMEVTKLQGALSSLLDWSSTAQQNMGPRQMDNLKVTTKNHAAAFPVDWKAVVRADRKLRLSVPYGFGDRVLLDKSYCLRVHDFR